MSEQPERHSLLDLLDGAGSGLVGIGLITMTAFPLALPFILLLAIAAIPVIIAGLAASVFVVPAVLLWRRLSRHRLRPADTNETEEVPERWTRATVWHSASNSTGPV